MYKEHLLLYILLCYYSMVVFCLKFKYTEILKILYLSSMKLFLNIVVKWYVSPVHNKTHTHKHKYTYTYIYYIHTYKERLLF